MSFFRNYLYNMQLCPIDNLYGYSVQIDYLLSTASKLMNEQYGRCQAAYPTVSVKVRKRLGERKRANDRPSS